MACRILNTYISHCLTQPDKINSLTYVLIMARTNVPQGILQVSSSGLLPVGSEPVNMLKRLEFL